MKTAKSISKKYIEEHHINGATLKKATSPPDLIVVVPCYDEPDFENTLDNWLLGDLKGIKVEIIIVVNSGENTPQAIVERNRKSYHNLLTRAGKGREAVQLSPILIENVRHKHAGVGFARKTGMDLALWRFLQWEKEEGIIASLDADTKVAANYFRAIYNCFSTNETLGGVVIRFEHPTCGSGFPNKVFEAITLYELHLRYLNQALIHSGFPYAHHTLGSAFALRASIYAKHGGMNRRQGGEDFYFLHKIFPHEKFGHLTDTCVYPSPRPSLRIPFGTGPQINNILKEKCLTSYDVESFFLLKVLFDKIPALHQNNVTLPWLIEDFLEQNDFTHRLNEIRQHSASFSTFQKRFYAFFDAFKIIKFLNFSHQNHFEKSDIRLQAKHLLEIKGIDSRHTAAALLEAYRKIEGQQTPL